MKKRNSVLQIIFLVFFFFTFSFSYSQKFRAGLLAGLISADVAGIDPYDIDFLHGGFTAGGFVNQKISDKSSWQFEILYSQKGSYQPPDSASGNFAYYRLNLDYVEVPVMFKHNITFNMNQKPVDRFGWESGPSVGILTKIKSDGLLYQNGMYISEASTDRGNFKRLDFLLNVGLSYRIVNNLSANVRYSQSIVPVLKRELLNQFFYYNWYKGDNMLFSFTLCYMFGAKNTE